LQYLALQHLHLLSFSSEVMQLEYLSCVTNLKVNGITALVQNSSTYNKCLTHLQNLIITTICEISALISLQYEKNNCEI